MNYSKLSPVQIISLTSIWQKTIGGKMDNQNSWEKDLKNVYALGMGMEEMLQFLYNNKPGTDEFLQWANERSSLQEQAISITADVLSKTDLEHWKANGYILLRKAITEAEQLAANRAIWEFLAADPEDPETWYREHPAISGLMLAFTQHEALQAVRNSARIRKAYEQLYGSTAIYMVIDKVSFNPPQNSQYQFRGSPLHWDTSLQLPIPDKFQGLIYLSDVTPEAGAFQCVPGFHHQISQWMASLPAGTDLRKHALETLQPVSIPGNAGDMIIWHQALPHCASPNLGLQPRLVQYLTYFPDGKADDRAWI